MEQTSVPTPGKPQSAAAIFLACDQLNHILIENLITETWTAKPPGAVRPIVAIFTHMQNIRIKWIRLNAPHLSAPERLNRFHCTQAEASAALKLSAALCATLLTEALDVPTGRIPTFRRDGWANPQPAGTDVLCYMLMHEAHHRGQICMLAHQLGRPLPGKITAALWDWTAISAPPARASKPLPTNKPALPPRRSSKQT